MLVFTLAPKGENVSTGRLTMARIFMLRVKPVAYVLGAAVV